MSEKPITGLFFISISKIVPTAAMGLFFIIFATILDTETYGNLGYIFSLATTATIISRFGLHKSVLIYRIKNNELLVNQVNSLAILTMSVASIILIFINVAAAVLCIGLSLFLLYQHNMLGTRNYKRYMKNSLVRIILAFVFPFPLYFLYDINGILIGIALGNILGSLPFFKSFQFNFNSFKLLKNNYKFLLSNFGVDIAKNLARSVDKLFVGFIFGYSTLGLFYFNMQIIALMELLPSSLYLFLLSEESSGRKQNKISIFIIIISSLIALVAIIISPFIIKQFFPNFLDGILSFQILAVSILPLSISSVLYAKMQSAESTIVGSSGIIRISTLIIFIYILGTYLELTGISLAVLFSSTINLIFLVILYRHFIKTNNHPS